MITLEKTNSEKQKTRKNKNYPWHKLNNYIIVLQLYNDVGYLVPNFTVTHELQVSPESLEMAHKYKDQVIACVVSVRGLNANPAEQLD